MLVQAGGKKFEKPEDDTYIGVIADVIDLGILPKTYNGKTTYVPKTRIIWLLNKNDSTGQPFQIMEQFTASMSETARLFKRVKQILGVAPPAPYDTDQLIGLTRRVFVVKEGEYSQIQGISPLKAGDIPMAIPAGYVRDSGQAAKRAAEKVAQATAPGQAQSQPAQQAQPAQQQAPVQQAVAADSDVAF